MPETHRHQPRATDVAIAALALSLLAMLIAPSIAESAADARRAGCLNAMKQISRALAGHEDSRLYYPLASTAPITAKPGDADDPVDRAGFSWLAQILPYLEQAPLPLYNSIQQVTAKMTTSPFVDAARRGESYQRPLAAVAVEQYLCPGFSGRPFVEVENSDYQSDGTDRTAPAIANYFASSSTHLIQRADGYFLSEQPTKYLDGNGALPLLGEAILNRGWKAVKGTTQAGLSRDGTSTLFMFCESRERAYAAWIDGQVAWTVAAWPTNPDAPKLTLMGPAGSTASQQAATLGWYDDPDWTNNVCIAKQPHHRVMALSDVYLPERLWSGSKPRKYGPSGNHPGVAAHAFADGHSEMVADDVDRNVYLHLTTRNGGEVISPDFLP